MLHYGCLLHSLFFPGSWSATRESWARVRSASEGWWEGEKAFPPLPIFPRAPCYPESRRSDWGRGSHYGKNIKNLKENCMCACITRDALRQVSVVHWFHFNILFVNHNFLGMQILYTNELEIDSEMNTGSLSQFLTLLSSLLCHWQMWCSCDRRQSLLLHKRTWVAVRKGRQKCSTQKNPDFPQTLSSITVSMQM